tara:strand:+ start:16 stop:600 length:585 start_codon:yes stop_codon:yes gene_type:complete
MTNATNQTTTTLQTEGQALTTAYRLKTNAFLKSIKAEGFDYRLGTLIKQIKQIENVSILSPKVKKKYNILKIDRRRTSEAEWLIDNSQSVADFVKKTKFRGTNINSLKNAMREASKTVSKETETVDAKASKVSHVGQSDTKVTDFGKFDAKKLLTANELAFEMLAQAEANSIPTKELLLALKEQIDLLSTEEVA